MTYKIVNHTARISTVLIKGFDDNKYTCFAGDKQRCESFVSDLKKFNVVDRQSLKACAFKAVTRNPSVIY